MATLDVGADWCEEGEEADSGPEPWGWLFPQNKSIVPQGALYLALIFTTICAAIDLVRDEYTFGRGEECDYHFESQNGKTRTPHYMALSNMHFRLFRVRKCTAGIPPGCFQFLAGEGYTWRLLCGPH